ncbi:MAG: ATP-binding protein, partial [Candidatus Omnitrophica bacterium]|nr:ATP-binding protein [Candidatus Omnitrophota bacterium]
RGFLNTTLKEMLAALEADCGSLFLFDVDNKELVLDSLYNSGDMHLKGLRQRIGEGVSGKVVNIKMPVLVKDINQDARFKRNGFQHYRTSSFISIPLFSSKGLMAVINIADKSNGQPFSEKDLNIASLICRYACLNVDNTICYLELKEQKDTLEKQKMALEKYASVGKLAAGVVHEVNNPLDGIIRYANILLNELEQNSLAHEYLMEIKRGLNRIANITKSLLDFSHQINSTSAQNKRYVDIHRLVEESLDVFSERVNGSIRVNKKYQKDLPRILDLGLAHVVINIIKNALDAMPEAGALEISTSLNNGAIEISFKDTGAGMPVSIKEQIFEPFFTTKDIDKGTGLGLAICNEIINKYEGKIEVESSEGKGSKFVISIPRKYLENAQ